MGPGESGYEAPRRVLLFMVFLGIASLGCAGLLRGGPGTGPGAWVAAFLVSWLPAAAAAATLWIRPAPAPDLGLRLPRLDFLVLALVFPVVLFVAIFGFSWSDGLLVFHVPPALADRVGSSGPAFVGAVLGLALGLFLLAGLQVLGEELGWRGLLVPALVEAGAPAPLVMAGLGYAAWLVPRYLPDALDGNFEPGLAMRCLWITCLSLGLILGRERLATGSIWPPLVFHAAFRALFLGLGPFLTWQDAGTKVLIGMGGMLTAFALGTLALALAATGAFRAGPPEPDHPLHAAMA